MRRIRFDSVRMCLSAVRRRLDRPGPARRRLDRPGPFGSTVVLRGGPWVVDLAMWALVATVAGLAVPAVLGRALDAALGIAPRPWLAAAAVLVVVLVAEEAAAGLASGSAAARSTASLRRCLVHHVLALGVTARGRFTSGDLAARLGRTAGDAGRLSSGVVGAAAGAATALGAAVGLALVDPWLGAAFVLSAPAVVALLGMLADDADAEPGYRRAHEAMAAGLAAAVAGGQSIAAAGTADREARRILRHLPELRERGARMWRAQARTATQGAFLVPLLEIPVLAAGGLQLSRGHITPGQLLAAVQYVALAASLGTAMPVFARAARSRAASRRVDEVLALIPPAYGTQELPPAGGGRLELRGVRAGMAGRQVLDGVDLVVPAGALVAVVGGPGAGTALLAAVAGRLLDPDEGDVLLDGVPLGELSRLALRRAVAYGFDRPVLFGCTIERAIAFGQGRHSRPGLVAAAGAAGAHGFVERLPDGYRTSLAEVPLPGGDRQRVGLARALLHGERLLVLADGAAGLGAVTERSIVRTLTGELGGRTRLVVASRASTAARADEVVWLEEGRVRATGSHRDLWRRADYRAVFAPPASEAARAVPQAHEGEAG